VDDTCTRRSVGAALLLLLAALLAAPPTAAADGSCQGFGSGTPGGSGGSVYHVTTLADSGPGSLRDAVSQGNRLVVFDVAGDIVLSDYLYVQGAFITIDGTTAPPPGITLRNRGLIIRGSRGAHDVIVRGIRVRDSALDGIQIAYGARNVVVDHVSVAGSGDGNLDISDSTDVTVCWSVFADAVSHGMSIKWSVARVSLHDNLFVGNIAGNPNAFIDSLGTPAADTTLDMRNNMVWHWGNGWGTAVHHGATGNVVANLYYSKNSLPDDQANALIVCRGDCNGDPASLARVYTEGNVSGDALAFDINTEGNEPAPFPAPAFPTRPACPAGHAVLSGAGARPLDAVDAAALATVTMPPACIVDLVVASVSPPPSASPGSTVGVPVGVRNRGPGNVTEPSTLRLYLSVSPALDGTAIEVGTATVPPIPALETAVVTVSAAIPGGAGAAGTYYLLAVADADEDTVEALETNNVGAAQIRIGPDLVVDAIGAPASAAPGATITVSDTTRNRGLGPVKGSVTRFYLSTLVTLDGSAIPLGERAVPPLDAGAVSSGSTTLVVPATAGSAGTYYILAVADGGSAVAEMEEGNNVRAARISIGPDFVVDVLTAPASAVAGTAIDVTDTVRNRGVGPAPATTITYYLSTTTALDGSAVVIGSRAVAALAAGATSTATTSVSIPATAGAAGTYYVLAVADAPGAVPELLETNNTRAWRISIGPDLVVDLLGAPLSAAPGASIDVSDTVRNRGVGPVGASVVHYYLSTTATVDATAVLLGSRPVPALAPAATHSGSATLTIPASAGAAGTYYVLAVADGDGRATEMDETNNLRAASIRVWPDLVVDAVTAPASAVAGASIIVSDTTRNRGGSAVGATRTRFYLSTIPGWVPWATELGARDVPALAAGGSSAGSVTLTLPASAGEFGTYYIVAVADGDRLMSEPDEVNNERAVRILIGPDLVIDTVVVPSTIGAGETVTVTDTVRNRGIGPSGPAVLRFYLSTRKTAEDFLAIPLAVRAISPLAAGATESAATTITIPTGTPPGTRYLVVVVDADRTVPETNEDNNSKYWTITIP